MNNLNSFNMQMLCNAAAFVSEFENRCPSEKTVILQPKPIDSPTVPIQRMLSVGYYEEVKTSGSSKDQSLVGLDANLSFNNIVTSTPIKYHGSDESANTHSPKIVIDLNKDQTSKQAGSCITQQVVHDSITARTPAEKIKYTDHSYPLPSPFQIHSSNNMQNTHHRFESERSRSRSRRHISVENSHSSSISESSSSRKIGDKLSDTPIYYSRLERRGALTGMSRDLWPELFNGKGVNATQDLVNVNMRYQLLEMHHMSRMQAFMEQERMIMRAEYQSLRATVNSSNFRSSSSTLNHSSVPSGTLSSFNRPVCESTVLPLKYSEKRSSTEAQGHFYKGHKDPPSSDVTNESHNFISSCPLNQSVLSSELSSNRLPKFNRSICESTGSIVHQSSFFKGQTATPNSQPGFDQLWRMSSDTARATVVFSAEPILPNDSFTASQEQISKKPVCDLVTADQVVLKSAPQRVPISGSSGLNLDKSSITGLKHANNVAVGNTQLKNIQMPQTNDVAVHTGVVDWSDDANEHSDSDYGELDDEAQEIHIGDLTLFNEFIVEEYFEKYEYQTLINNDDAALLEEKENEEPLPQQYAIQADLKYGDLGFEEINTDNRRPNKYNHRKAVQEARMKGLEYKRSDGVVIPARSVKPPCSCTKYKCHEKYGEEIRQKLMHNLLKLTSSGQNQFLSNHMTIRNTVRPKGVGHSRRMFTRSYFLPAVNGRIHVCKEMFMNTFDVKDKKLRVLADKKVVGSGITADDLRSKNRSQKTLNENELEFIEQHIRSFPAYTSHYARERSSKLYLSSDLNINRMHELYKQKCLEDGRRSVQYFTYRKVFKKMNLAFRKLKVDTCCKCDKLAISLKIASDEEKEKIEATRNEHHEEAQEAYRQKKFDVQRAKADGRFRTASFDLQKCLPTPHLTTGIAFYKRQLYTYNLTVFSTHRSLNSVTCFLWDESKARRGSQEIGSCLLKDLQGLNENVQEMIYYSDRCSGQNHNIIICTLFLYFIETCIKQGRKLTIQHKFMVPGHSHMEVDSAHGSIEKAKKRCAMNIETPRDWAVFIAAINRKVPFKVVELEQSSFLALKNLQTFYKRPKSNSTGDPIRFKDISVFKYTTDDPGVVHYKYKLGDTDFRKFTMNRDFSDPVVLPLPITDEPIPIAEEKLQDLRKLMEFVSNKAFYDTLLKQIVPKKRGRRSKNDKPDHFDADLDEEEEFVVDADLDVEEELV
ncbi:uncharacterized protein LOC134220417 [Armigeres subalbatus]|uniref:uncharacterized protein LOC134220417 n=1 Tax=Armigeres subalbatus TaxID=124917 RepID=UPI002ED1E005